VGGIKERFLDSGMHRRSGIYSHTLGNYTSPLCFGAEKHIQWRAFAQAKVMHQRTRMSKDLNLYLQ
jgi:hypothetical protein